MTGLRRDTINDIACMAVTLRVRPKPDPYRL